MLTEHEIVESLLVHIFKFACSCVIHLSLQQQSDGDILRWTIHSPVTGWQVPPNNPLDTLLNFWCQVPAPPLTALPSGIFRSPLTMHTRRRPSRAWNARIYLPNTHRHDSPSTSISLTSTQPLSPIYDRHGSS